jgi:hypothetical protein
MQNLPRTTRRSSLHLKIQNHIHDFWRVGLRPDCTRTTRRSSLHLKIQNHLHESWRVGLRPDRMKQGYALGCPCSLLVPCPRLGVEGVAQPLADEDGQQHYDEE